MGGDSPSRTAGATTAESMQAYIKYLPQLLSAANDQIYSSGKAQLDASGKLSDQANQQGLDTFSKYAPQLAAAGNAITKQNAQAGADTTASVLGSDAAKNTATSGTALDRLANPEFYNTKELASNKLGELLNSINLNGLSGGERAEAERSINRDNVAGGNANTPSALGTVSNAMNFGSALNAKRSALSGAINSATQFLPASRSSFDPNATVLAGAAAGTQNNPGLSQFQAGNANQGAGTVSNSMDFFKSIMGAGVNANNLNAQNRDGLDRVTGVLGSLPSVS